jgi:phosphoadenosine phosphosulfate reductase
MRLPDAGIQETEETEHPGPALATRLQRDYGGLDAPALLEVMLRHVFPGRVAMVSSFGTESAVLLDLVAEVERSTPVLFLDTGQLFEETLRYRDALTARLGLTDVRVLRPAPASLAADDPDSQLWYFDPDHCCRIRKVLPLQHGLEGFDAWITGRKRFQGGLRGRLSAIEAGPDGRIKINPLAGWTPREIAARFASRNLPQHPLLAQGFRSIGCLPCTDRVGAGEDPRAGRWRNRPKTECGIHLPAPA